LTTFASDDLTSVLISLQYYSFGLLHYSAQTVFK